VSPAGRTPLPTAVRKLRGNAGRRPLNEAEPVPPAGPVKAPPWLTLVDAGEDLEALTVVALRRRCRDAGIAGCGRMRKAELVEALRAVRVTPHEELWHRYEAKLGAMQVLTPADEEALALLVDVHVEVLELREVVRAQGRTYMTEGRGGLMKRENPSYRQLREVRREWVTLAREFGLTPASRSRLKVDSFEPADPLDGLLT